MNSVRVAALRSFSPEEHIRSVLEGEWIELVDEAGRGLPGIRGKIGASIRTAQGVELGADAIEMQPGSAFPLHVHEGDHVLYVIRGEGVVHVDGRDHRVREGDTITIAAEYPHGVRARNDGSSPLLFLAVGHPHKHLSARDRMRLVDESGEASSPQEHMGIG